MISAPSLPPWPRSSARVLRLADVPATPWRNGGGVTHELLAGPSASSSADAPWRWRLSVAVIAANGPFSAFPGVRRWFTVIEGAGVELDLHGRTLVRRCEDTPLSFDGAAAPACRLIDGPTRDLNLMLRGVGGGLVAARAGVVWSPQVGLAGQTGQTGLYTRSACSVQAAGQRWEVPADALLWLDIAPPVLQVDADSESPLAAWWIVVGEDVQAGA